MPQKPISVLVADSAFVSRKGLRVFLDEMPEFDCVAEAADQESLRDAVQKYSPDVVTIAHCCEACFSFKVIENFRAVFPKTNVLVVSHDIKLEEIRKVIGAGIGNYLLNSCNEKEFRDGIIACSKGERYFAGEIIELLLKKNSSLKEPADIAGITERESEIIQMLVSGKRPKEIANDLFISPFTVNTHKKNIYRKLGIGHSYELAQYAYKSGLVFL